MITFYGKPGCQTNRKQQAMLRAAGYELRLLNLLEYPWRREELAAFFTGLPVAQWFNPAAPAVRDGRVDPASLDREAALDCLLAQPLLIRRPLLAYHGRCMAGFDAQRLGESLGVMLFPEGDARSAPEGCARAGAGGHCP